MGWENQVKKYFSNAAPCYEVFTKANWLLTEAGLTPQNTLYAECICRDEINRAAMQRMVTHWGEGFNLSGLAGFPVDGVTSFGAYAAHVPDGGNLLIVYGPHVGFDRDGRIGHIHRPGMSATSTSCGSLLHFLSKIEKDAGYKPEFDIDDAGQYVVEQSLHTEAAAILGSDSRIQAVTEAAFAKVDESLKRVINKVNPSVEVYLLGGILVNAPESDHDLFAVKSASLRDPGGSFVEGWYR